MTPPNRHRGLPFNCNRFRHTPLKQSHSKTKTAKPRPGIPMSSAVIILEPSLHKCGVIYAGHLMSTYVFLMSLRVQRLPGNGCLYSMPNKHFYSCCYKSKRRSSAVEVAHIPKCSRTSLILHRL